MKEHESWWQLNLPKPDKMDTGYGKTFRGWLRGPNAESRVEFRKLLKQYNYKSMLDCAAGLCDEYTNLDKSIKYSAIDITQKLVDYNLTKGIEIHQASVESLPFKDNSFEVVYARHLLEHLDYYEKALIEMIRVAEKAVVVVFFRSPTDEDDLIELTPSSETKLYQNVYNRQKIENLIYMNTDVGIGQQSCATVEWLQPDSLKHGRWADGEVIMHAHWPW